MSKEAMCTIASKNYLARVRTLAESFRAHHPDVPVYFLLVDRLDGFFDPGSEAFTTVELESLPIRNLQGFCFQYTAFELNTAVKPLFLKHLFEKHEFERILYFDPDIRIYAPVTDLFSALREASVLLTPHLTEPMGGASKPDELEILRAGAYSLGFIGLARTPATGRLLDWWWEKLRAHCVADPSRNLFADQRWMDLAPGMFDGVRIVRDPGCHVAHWNLQHRPIEYHEGAYRVRGAPLRFFHFSGFDPREPETVSRHGDRFRMDDMPALRQLFREYAQDLVRHGYEPVADWPYAFARFDDGTAVPDVARRLYRELGDEAERFGDPFRTAGPDSFLAWLNAPAEGFEDGPPVITRIALAIYRSRPDLHMVLPKLEGEGRLTFTTWLAEAGPEQYGLDGVFIQALRNLPPGGGAEQARRRVALVEAQMEAYARYLEAQEHSLGAQRDHYVEYTRAAHQAYRDIMRSYRDLEEAFRRLTEDYRNDTMRLTEAIKQRDREIEAITSRRLYRWSERLALLLTRALRRRRADTPAPAAEERGHE